MSSLAGLDHAESAWRLVLDGHNELPDDGPRNLLQLPPAFALGAVLALAVSAVLMTGVLLRDRPAHQGISTPR